MVKPPRALLIAFTGFSFGIREPLTARRECAVSHSAVRNTIDLDHRSSAGPRQPRSCVLSRDVWCELYGPRAVAAQGTNGGLDRPVPSAYVGPANLVHETASARTSQLMRGTTALITPPRCRKFANHEPSRLKIRLGINAASRSEVTAENGVMRDSSIGTNHPSGLAIRQERNFRAR